MVKKKAYNVNDLKGISWIKIELKDEKGNPFSGEEYLVILPNGEEKKGKLDDNGYAKVTGIPKEGCAISFPNLEDFEVKG